MVGITVMASPVQALCMSFVQRMKRNVAIPSSALHKSFIFHERGCRNTRTHIKSLFFLRTLDEELLKQLDQEADFVPFFN
jgi:hypothetical protein